LSIAFADEFRHVSLVKLNVVRLSLDGVLLITPRRFEDERGYLAETYSAEEFSFRGVTATFVQENQSFSARAGTVRGLHLQVPPAAQAKLVRVVRGSIFDVAVDLRQGSPAYGRWCGKTLTAAQGEQLFIPRGFAHGFCTLEPETEVLYKIDSYYAPPSEVGVIWNDPDIDISWPVSSTQAILSDKDKKLPPFRQFHSPFVL
jgi:dTDP-4-dehydrorhamnose 3,5-epimerase